MKVSGKVKRRFGKTLIAVAIVFATPLFEGGKPMSGAHTNDAFAGKEVVVVLDLCDDMYSTHGLETGFNYQLAERFAEDNRCEIKIISAGKKENWLDSLQHGKADIVIMHDHSDISEDILLSRNVDEHTVWGISDDKYLEQVNLWISHMTSSHEYDKMKRLYITSQYNPLKRAERGQRSSTISPYDDTIRKYAKELFKSGQYVEFIKNLPHKYFEEDNMPQTKLHRDLEGGMTVSLGRLREDSQYDYKFVGLSHNTLRGAAGGAVLLAELLCAENYITRK